MGTINFKGGTINFKGSRIYFGDPNKTLTPELLLTYQVYVIEDSNYNIYYRVKNNDAAGTLYYGSTSALGTSTAIGSNSSADLARLGLTLSNTYSMYSKVTASGKTDSDTISSAHTLITSATSAPSFVSVNLYDPDPMGDFPRSLLWRITVTNHDSFPADIYSGYVQTKDGSTPVDPTDASVTTLRLSNVAAGASVMWEQTTGSVTLIESSRLKIKLKIKGIAKNVVDTQAKPVSSIVASGTISG